MVFEKGFHDRILKNRNQFDTLIHYIISNPYRLAVRRRYPEYFRRINNLQIAGKNYQAYGNMFLLQNPMKEQVVIHRSDSDTTRAYNRDRWLYPAANGGILVSPFISSAEKAILSEAEALGGRIILIQDQPFPAERYKPTAHNFDLCTSGRLLIIAPTANDAFSTASSLTRSTCLAMNNLAKVIAVQSPSPVQLSDELVR